MYFRFFVEDISGKRMLERLVPKIIGDGHQIDIFGYRGLDRLPDNLDKVPDPQNRTLMGNLPRILRGGGKELAGMPAGTAYLVIVCDLDDNCLKEFRGKLFSLLSNINPAPPTLFFFAIEEGEAWLLGDIKAVSQAYPKAKREILRNYVSDSICGSWEKLADAVYPGGVRELKNYPYSLIGRVKCEWAEKVAELMEPDNNKSPSFRYFRDKLRALCSEPTG